MEEDTPNPNLPVPVPQAGNGKERAAGAHPETADERTRANAERQRRLFEWAATVLEQAALTRAINAARTALDLATITFDPKNVEVVMAIQDALHPVSGKGKRESHFAGLNEANLQRLLQARLAALINERAKELGGKWNSELDWSKKLERDKKVGKVIGNVANLVLIFRNAPKWKDVLSFNEFAMQVELSKRLNDQVRGPCRTAGHRYRPKFDFESINRREPC